MFLQVLSSLDPPTSSIVQKELQHHVKQSSNWKRLLQTALAEWKEQPVDIPRDIAAAVNRYKIIMQPSSEQRCLFGGHDILWWQHCTGRLPLRNLAKLRRTLSPLTIRSTNQENKIAFYTLEHSLVDILLRCAETQSSTVDLLLRYLVLLQIWTKGAVASTKIRFEYRKLQELLLEALHRLGGRYLFRGKRLKLVCLEMKHLPMAKAAYGNQRSYPDNTFLELLDIREKRIELHKRARRRDGSALKPRRLVRGAELWTDHDLTEGEFLLESGFMAKVNATLARQFDPLVSRPRLARAPFNSANIRTLKAVLFGSDGALNADCKADVSTSIMHHYIQFANVAKAGNTDKRWQVPIKQHSQGCVRTRSRIESILIDAGIIDPSKEKIHDLVLLIGGTEDQSLHHDTPRQMTCYLPTRIGPSTDEQAILGWETNRLAYNKAMSKKCAPSSTIVGMGDNGGDILIGVQKDQIERNRFTREECRIVNGKPDEVFSIVRENHHLVVLKAKPGVTFTGDFPHCGVRNFASGSPEDSLMNALIKQIDEILHSDFQDDKQIFMIVELLGSFRGLKSICRFFCTTVLLETNTMLIPNTIGFTDCHNNFPDGHG
jgi:hypothetical protein